jgi:hypothetical protein
MKQIFTLSIILNTLFLSTLSAQTDTSSITWILDRVDSIGGYQSNPYNELPTLIETSQGKAAFFDGINDGILLNCNPIGSATEFTLEVILFPDSTATQTQPRFLHIRRTTDQNRRITMETRILANKQWILDTYIRSEISQCTQLDSSYTHTSGEWHHTAIVYGNHTMKQYIDGILQRSDTVTYLPMDTDNPKISIGVRQDKLYFFKGAIRLIKISKRALVPEEFTLPIITSVPSNKEIPSKIKLLQNYPNPFNPTTEIRFEIGDWGLVTLKIFDVLGREVATLLNEIKHAGDYSVQWNAERIPSGVYFYRLTTGNFSQTRKLLLLK